MPANIIETNSQPFKRVDLDPITLDIIENAMLNARWEMDAVLFRTAMSPGIREQHDEFPMIANLEGKMVVGQFGSFIHGFQQGYEGDIEEGDIFLTTDPYACNGAVSHANDWLMLAPIYKDGRVISWAAMFGHMTDIGGKVPGSLPTDARQIYEEGIIVPPTKIYKKGELQADILNLILHNCRLPHWNRSDFNAIVAAIRTAEKRCIELAERFGDDVYCSALDELLDRNKRAMAKLIKDTVPEEKQYFEDYVCDDGMGMGPYKIACSMWREGDIVVFDFEGTDPQSIGSINFLLNEEMFKMFCGVFMIMVFDPQIMFNDGFYPISWKVRIPEGSILKPRQSRGAFVSHPRVGSHLRCTQRVARAGQARTFLCAAGLLRQPPLHVFRLRSRRASGISSTRSALAAMPGAADPATGRTGTRSGRASRTCRTNSSRATSRCASTST